MLQIDLTQGISDNAQYKAFKFPGGEIHVIIKDAEFKNNGGDNIMRVIANFKSSDDIMLCMLVCDILQKDYYFYVELFIPYMAYQQADRNFSKGESFSLNTFAGLLSHIKVNKTIVFDPHSDVTPALLSTGSSNQIEVITNHSFINSVIKENFGEPDEFIILSPDAGAYKKISKLTEALKLDVQIETAVKSRNTKDGSLITKIYRNDFGGKSVLIVDDICVGGATFVSLAQQLQNKNIGELYLAISHGIFSNGFAELSQYFDGIYTTNSWSTKKEIDDKLQIGLNTKKFKTALFFVDTYNVI